MSLADASDAVAVGSAGDFMIVPTVDSNSVVSARRQTFPSAPGRACRAAACACRRRGSGGSAPRLGALPPGWMRPRRNLFRQVGVYSAVGGGLGALPPGWMCRRRNFLRQIGVIIAKVPLPPVPQGPRVLIFLLGGLRVPQARAARAAGTSGRRPRIHCLSILPDCLNIHLP